MRVGIFVDTRVIANDLQTRICELRQALGDVQREERDAQVTREARNAALNAWSSSYQGVADTTTGLFELAGQSGLADRVRLTARRRAGMTEEADTASGAGAEPAATA